MSGARRKTVFAAPTTKTAPTLTKRPSTTSVATSSTSRLPSITSKQNAPVSVIKPRNSSARPKVNKNTTVMGDGDTTIAITDPSIPDFSDEYRELAYGKFLRSMLEACLVDEKIEREETEIDIQMTHLAKRLHETTEQLDKTSRRVKDISFLVEQKRLLDLKNQDSEQYFDLLEKDNTQNIVRDLAQAEQAALDRLQTKNVDFGYTKESGHKQLLDAVNDAITGLDTIKKHSKLDIEKFKAYEKTQTSIEDLERDRTELEIMRKDFEKKFPTFNERLIKEASASIAKYMDDDDVEDY